MDLHLEEFALNFCEGDLEAVREEVVVGTVEILLHPPVPEMMYFFLVFVFFSK